MRPLLISGIPAAGKTSVARLLAARTERGVHIETDVFFGFVRHLVDPSTPPAKSQNETVVRAYCASARVYVKAGYAVVMDGVIGPWMWPLMQPMLGEFDYVLLAVSASEALRRNRERPSPISPGIVERMLEPFARLDGKYARHVIDSECGSVAEIARLIDETRGDGRYAVAADTGQPV